MIPIGTPFTLSYQHDPTNQAITSVQVSIINAYGLPITLEGDTTALNLATTQSGSTWTTASITIPETEKSQDVRVYYTIKNNAATITPKAGYNPLREKLEVPDTFDIEYVSSEYFETFFIAKSSKADAHFEEAIENFLAASPTGFKPYIDRSVAEIERDGQFYLGKRLIEGERRDFYNQEPFIDNRWMTTTDRGPIISLEKVELYFGKNLIASINPEFFVVHKKSKQFEIVPTGGFIMNMDQTAAQILSPGLYGSSPYLMAGSRVPGFFRYDYYAGIDFPSLPVYEQESIKQLICLKTLMTVIPMVSPESRQASISVGVDGVNRSQSYRPDQFIQMIDREYQNSLQSLLRNYGNSGVDIVVI
ncbi:MAG: hypothetical protein HUU10_04460 [Bacteroidetes bacterium]|nr:hypothetical protein [Bacteroidota bacterium]